MGQVQSDEPGHDYECETGDHISQDVTDLEINSKEHQASDDPDKKDKSTTSPVVNDELASGKEGAKGAKILKLLSKITTNISRQNTGNGAQKQCCHLAKKNVNYNNNNNNNNLQDEHVRKLSIVSHRNIQLLSMKPRSDTDAYADELRGRRRSSLINLILGAPSSGPRFSDDLCSLSSHMSELCNFGIEFFPNYNPLLPAGPTRCSIGSQPINCSLPFGGNYSSASSDWHHHHHRRRRHHPHHRNHHVDLERSVSHKIGQQFFSKGNTGELCGGGGGGGVANSSKSREHPHDLGPSSHHHELSRQRRRRSSLGSLASSVSEMGTNCMAHHRKDEPPASPRATQAPQEDKSSSSQQSDNVNHAGDNNQSNSSEKDTNKQPDDIAYLAKDVPTSKTATMARSKETNDAKQQQGQLRKHPSLASTLKSIDLTSSFEKHDNSGPLAPISQPARYSCSSWSSSSSGSGGGCSSFNSKSRIFNITPKQHQEGPASKLTKPSRLNQTGRVLRRSGSELSLYSTLSANSEAQETFGNTYVNSSSINNNNNNNNNNRHRSYYHYNISENNRLDEAAISKSSHHYDDYYDGPAEHVGVFRRLPSSASSGSSFKKVNTKQTSLSSPSPSSSLGDPSRETKLIIMLQVCLPFILAGFGNMAAGLVLNQIAHWRAFKQVPVFFVLLPSFVGLKGNIEMTLASRLSTLSNLNLLDSSRQRRHAYVSNLILILSQAIGLSTFAAILSILCECLMTNNMMMAHGNSINSSSSSSSSNNNNNASLSSKSDADAVGGLAVSGPALATTVQVASAAGEGAASNLSGLLVISGLVVLPSAVMTATVLVIISSFVMSFAIALANYIRVNPDNLSTLIAALYGDVSCVLTYGLFAELMYSLNEQGGFIWPTAILGVTLISYPALCYLAYRFKETHSIALTSMPPMLTGIVVSMGSGAVLSLFVGRFSLIALYQPVVNGFGANLIAVQASRVSTWLWCKELQRRASISQQQQQQQGQRSKPSQKGPLATFTPAAPTTSSQQRPSIKHHHQQEHFASNERILEHDQTTSPSTTDLATKPRKMMDKIGNFFEMLQKFAKLTLWSFFNPSPNSIAARLLLIMLIPAHTLYFFVIWLLSPANYVVITWQFYFVYISLCLVQVFILLSICEPLMTLLMKRHLDPDVFGISLLMALADLVGTLCLAGAFIMLARVGDVNAHK